MEVKAHFANPQMLGAILGDRKQQTEDKKIIKKLITFEISIETILYIGTVIMLTLSVAVVLTVYFLHSNYLKQTDNGQTIIIRNKKSIISYKEKKNIFAVEFRQILTTKL